MHHARRRLIVVPARSAIVERQDGVAREICWNGIRGGIVDLHHLIGIGEDRLGNAVDEIVRERSVGYDDRADQGRDCGAAEIQRIAENAPRWPDMNTFVQPSSTWP